MTGVAPRCKIAIFYTCRAIAMKFDPEIDTDKQSLPHLFHDNRTIFSYFIRVCVKNVLGDKPKNLATYRQE